MITASKKMMKVLKNGAARMPLLRDDTSGIALTEFAFTMPIILSLGMLGTETAYYTITHMRLSQVAMQVADNASRVGETEVLSARRVFESDINDVFIGAYKLGGGLEILENGRVILSSLQQNSNGGQWIAWQRCKGTALYDSSFGEEDDGETGTDFPGMGETGEEIKASGGTAVMFVEIVYDYQGLTPFDDIIPDQPIRYTAAFNIRDSRDLSGLTEDTPAVTPSTCDVYDAF